MPTTYASTRSSDSAVSLSTALTRGIAPDGGLYIPTPVPPLPDGWRDGDSFADLAVAVLDPWLSDDVPDWEFAVRDALDFPIPLVELEPGLSVLELFHGPTYSFKDFGARTMARLLARLRNPADEPLTILVATSGDTGSAVADGFAGLPGFRVVLLFPDGQVSPVQERQLVMQRDGVTSLRVAGTFDDCQRMVKAAFADPKLSAIPLSSANSINIGRLLPQMLFYVEAMRQWGGEEAVFVTPSGNLGNLTGGVMAMQAGLPVRRFIAAHNANRFFPDRLAGGDAQMGASIATLSNAMDVGAPSNFERIHKLLGDSLSDHIWGATVSDDDTLISMKRAYDRWGYVACPHTAVGLEAARRYRDETGDPTPQIVLATAHPAKFPDVVARAIGNEPQAPEPLAALQGERDSSVPIAATPDALRAVLLAPSRRRPATGPRTARHSSRHAPPSPGSTGSDVRGLHPGHHRRSGTPAATSTHRPVSRGQTGDQGARPRSVQALPRRPRVELGAAQPTAV